MASKMLGMKLRRGQKVRLETPGGGGYGNVGERDMDRIAEDVRLGYLTPAAARRDYACVVSADGVLDRSASENLRREDAQ